MKNNGKGPSRPGLGLELKAGPDLRQLPALKMTPRLRFGPLNEKDFPPLSELECIEFPATEDPEQPDDATPPARAKRLRS